MKDPITEAMDCLKSKLPFDAEAEQAVIGCVLIDRNSIHSIRLNPGDFYDDANREVWNAIMLLHHAGKPIDLALLVSTLRESGKWDAVGGAAKIASYSNAVPNASHAEYYSEIVANRAERRRLIVASCNAIVGCQDSDDITATAGELERAAADATIDPGNTTVTFRHVVGDLLSLADRAEAGEEVGSYVESGFPPIDDNYGGFPCSGLIVIAARPSDGKSAFGKQITSHLASQGTKVLFVSLEMSQIEVASRVLSERMEVDGTYIKSGDIDASDREMMMVEHDDPMNDNLLIATPTGADARWTRIAGLARYHKATSGIGMVVLDYLQIVEQETAGQSDYDRVTKASRGAKQLARELEIPVIALAQIGRESDKGNRRPPRLSDLRDSGAIEQDADAVLFLHRKNEDGDDFSLIVAKYRDGQKLNFDMKLHGKFTKFEYMRGDDGF